MTAASWESALDAFEARLDAQRAALELSAVDIIAPFVAASVAGPLPPECVDRAVALVHACRALEDDIATALEAARGELDRLGDQSATPSPARGPVYFDSRV